MKAQKTGTKRSLSVNGILLKQPREEANALKIVLGLPLHLSSNQLKDVESFTVQTTFPNYPKTMTKKAKIIFAMVVPTEALPAHGLLNTPTLYSV